MRCQYCHNPDTWAKKDDELVMTPKEAFDKAYRYHTYWRNNGGITVSGGEALLQPEFVTELIIQTGKEEKVHTCLDTSGNRSPGKSRISVNSNELMQYMI